MGFIKDIIKIFKKYEISYVKKVNDIGDIYTFYFQSTQDIKWIAGQHGLFKIEHKKIKKPRRVFSIASTCEEEYLMISTKISKNPSPFKTALMALKPGMKISMRGPIGPFYISDHKPTLLIAGGIGITPYRAILKNEILSTRQLPNPIKLLYIQGSKEYLYVDDFERFEQRESIDIAYLDNRGDFQNKITDFVKEYGNEATYFLTGSKKMTDDLTKSLKSQGIEKGNVKKDIFYGY